MKNQDSFNLENTVYSPSDAFCFNYRATNSFNAIVPGRAVKYPGGFASDGDRNFSFAIAGRKTQGALAVESVLFRFNS